MNGLKPVFQVGRLDDLVEATKPLTSVSSAEVLLGNLPLHQDQQMIYGYRLPVRKLEDGDTDRSWVVASKRGILGGGLFFCGVLESEEIDCTVKARARIELSFDKPEGAARVDRGTIRRSEADFFKEPRRLVWKQVGTGTISLVCPGTQHRNTYAPAIVTVESRRLETDAMESIWIDFARSLLSYGKSTFTEDELEQFWSSIG